MSAVLNTVRRVRHGAIGERLPFLWTAIRPLWQAAARVATRGRGFPHLINGVDTFRLSIAQMPNGDPMEWEPEQYQEVMSVIGPGDHVLDIGSFWGLFALGAARRVGESGRVIAVEPGPRQYSMLTTNVAINAFSDLVTCVNEVCAAEADQSIEFYADPNGSMIDSAVPNDDRTTVAIQLRSTTIDELVQRFDLHPNVIKIDVEGFEDLVLSGAKDTLSRFRPTVFVEFHPEELATRGRSAGEVMDTLTNFGLRCEPLASVQPESIPRGHLFKFVSYEAAA